MKDLREASYILRIKIDKDKSKMVLHLLKKIYIEKVLKEFSMKNSKREIVSFRHRVHLSKMMCLSTPEEIECMSLDPLYFYYREPHVCYAMYSIDISLTMSVMSKISIKSRQEALDSCEIYPQSA